MKRILSYIMLLPLLFTGCDDKDDIVFPHEEPQFETRSDVILLEVITPQGTASSEAIYIVGDFNGGEEVAVGLDKWKLHPAPNSPYKWGIYVNPDDFVDGKTLADGYYFYSFSQGREKSPDNQDVVHTENASVGERINNVRAQRWASYFVPGEDIWPTAPSDRIMLRVTIPNSTPLGYQIALYGEANGWNGADLKWQGIPVDQTHLYFLINPADFAVGKTLADMFKFGLLNPGGTGDQKEWWYYQDNEDGGDSDGAGHMLENALVGKAYDITIVNWRNSADLPASQPKIYLIIEVPSDTPADVELQLWGDPNGWNGGTGWSASLFDEGKYIMALDPTAFAPDKSLADKFFITSITPASTAAGKDWWFHQNNDDGSENEGPGFTIAETETSRSYTLTIANWRNSESLKSGQY